MADQIHQIFTEPQTCYKFLDKEVSNQSLDDLYSLLKWGPTSFNCSPMRLKFLKSKQAKENLSRFVSEDNVSKVLNAPVCTIIGLSLIHI